MKKSMLMTLAVLFVFGLWVQETMARGLGGRGFGGGGARAGGYRSGGAAFRSPSMSAPVTRHAAPRPSSAAKKQVSAKQRMASQQLPGKAKGKIAAGKLDKAAVGRPTEGQLQQFLNLPQSRRPSRRPDMAQIGAGAVAGALGVEGARKLLEQHRPGGLEKPSQLPARSELAGRIGQPGRPSTLPARDVGNAIRDNWQTRRDRPFTPEWWREHPHAAWRHWDRHHHPWNYWWRPATWAALAAWTAGVAAGGAYGDPVYYDYGGDIYYEGEDVYAGGQKTATAQEYYQQAGALADQAPPAAASEDEDWMPLGVFALTKGSVADSNMVLQLAISRQGVISGTYYNTATDTVRPLKGMVDKKSQRAAWTFSDGKNTDIIMETGIYNLTQDQTAALVHFGKDKTQQWLMVRLNQPGEQQRAEEKDEMP